MKIPWGVLALFCLAGPARPATLQEQVDDLREAINRLEINQLNDKLERQQGQSSGSGGLALEQMGTAIHAALDSRVVVGVSAVASYQNFVGQPAKGDASLGLVGNRGGGIGVADAWLAGRPMINTLLFMEFEGGYSRGPQALASGASIFNAISYQRQRMGAPAGALDGVILREAWLRIGEPKDPVMLQAGHIDLGKHFDTNVFANDERSQFLGQSFVNNPVLENPPNGLGFTLQADLGGGMTARVAWQDASTGEVTAFDESYAAVPWTGHDGNFRLWARARSGVAADSLPAALGFSLDQRMTNCLSLFVRWAKANPLDAMDQAFSAGLVLDHWAPSREKDAVGLAYAEMSAWDNSRESQAEAYYQVVLTPNLSVSLHLQSAFLRSQAGIDQPPLYVVGSRMLVGY